MIICVGAGPGSLDYMTQRGADLVRTADVVAGFDAVVRSRQSADCANARVVTMGYRGPDSEIAGGRRGTSCQQALCRGFHGRHSFQWLSISRACRAGLWPSCRNPAGHLVRPDPGVAGKVCFDETTFVTFHRRGDLEPFKRHLVHVLADERNAIVIPRPWDFMPKDVAPSCCAGCRG